MTRTRRKENHNRQTKTGIQSQGRTVWERLRWGSSDVLTVGCSKTLHCTVDSTGEWVLVCPPSLCAWLGWWHHSIPWTMSLALSFPLKLCEETHAATETHALAHKLGLESQETELRRPRYKRSNSILLKARDKRERGWESEREVVRERGRYSLLKHLKIKTRFTPSITSTNPRGLGYKDRWQQ